MDFFFDWLRTTTWATSADWGELAYWEVTLRLAAATILGGAIGFERERRDRAAGLRTHALVSVGAALAMIVSTYGFPLPPAGSSGSLDPSRIAAQVVSGVGFLGAGVIIFRDNTVRGLTTAVTVWAVAGVGLAAGGGLYVAALVGTAFMLLVQAGLKPIERKIFAKYAKQHRILLTVDHGVDALEGIHFATAETPVRLRSLQFDHARGSDLDVVELTLLADTQQQVLDLLTRLREVKSVHSIAYGRRSSIVQRRVRDEGHDFGHDEDDDEGNDQA
ncbi:MAG TPA: MgtC/SapB family protein [Polyangiaceae bacterium]|nr:MgtC/SapB family protein [Polyangiaceae bacterium]